EPSDDTIIEDLVIPILNKIIIFFFFYFKIFYKG
ncbi:hypothetical protein LCGC14_2934120, partial [marine sediment metagenome]